MSPELAGQLKRVRVLDLTRLLPGPYATHMLRSYGADVIKIEDTGAGDYARSLHPLERSGMGAAFTAANAGKRSLSVDLKTEAGRELVMKLVRGADVLVESFRPGTMARLGLAHADLMRANPKLIVCAITGYGQQTEDAQLAGHDLNYQGWAGLLAPTEGGVPPMPDALLADLVGGSFSAVIAILAALVSRDATGRGTFIDLSITHSAMMLQPLSAATLLDGGEQDPHAAMRHHGAHPAYRIYGTADGKFVTFAALEQKFWAKFCALAGCEDLGEPIDTGDSGRMAHICARLTDLFKSQTQAQWVALGRQWDVCLGPVLTGAEALVKAQADQLPVFERFRCGGRDCTTLSGRPADLAWRAADAVARPPAQGEHNMEVLVELGLAEDAILHWHATGVVRSASPASPG